MQSSKAIAAIKSAAVKSGVIQLKKDGKVLGGNILDWIRASESGLEDEDLSGYANKFAQWCKSDEQAESFVAACTYAVWSSKLSEETAPDQHEVDDVKEWIAGQGARARNKAAMAQQKAREALKEFDPATYQHPGPMLEKLMDQLDLDWDLVVKLTKLQSQQISAADLQHAKAAWELANNKPPPDEQYVATRKRLMTEALASAEAALEIYKAAVIEDNKQQAKLGVLDDIKVAATAKRPAQFTSNALCVKLWQCACDNAGTGGYFELVSEHDAAELKNAWKAWGEFQNVVTAAPIPGFKTHKIGNGTAQDKSTHQGFELRSHTHQMNFSVTWKGQEQMIHVGLKGTRKK